MSLRRATVTLLAALLALLTIAPLHWMLSVASGGWLLQPPRRLIRRCLYPLP